MAAFTCNPHVATACREVDSPVGPLRLLAHGTALLRIDFLTRKANRAVEPLDDHTTHPACHAILDHAEIQLDEYFAGGRRDFTIPLDPRGTAFQRRVWGALRSVRFGVTTTYGQLALMLGQPTASRAVGLANGANPLPIIVPCHRVVGRDGGLTGFAGGLAIKRQLLEHEGALTPTLFVRGNQRETLRFSPPVPDASRTQRRRGCDALTS